MKARDTRETKPGLFFRKLWMVIFSVAVAVAIWRVVNVLLATFFGVFIAILLNHAATLTSRSIKISYGKALTLVVILLLAFIVGAGWLAGPQLTVQIEEISRTLPQAWQSLQQAIQNYPFGRMIDGILNKQSSSGLSLPNLFQHLGDFMTSVLGALAGAVLVVAVAILGAADPDAYRDGIIHLAPPVYRKQTQKVLKFLAYELWRWTCGQFIAMALVGTLTFGGLLILGVPSAFALGLIAGLLEFVPMAGPIVSIGVSTMVAFTVSLNTALYVLVLCTCIQQFESNVLVPFIQKRTIWIPPVLSVVSIMALGVLFGITGVLLSGPLVTTMVVLAQILYVESYLDENMQLPLPKEE